MLPQIRYLTRCLTSCFRKVNLCSRFSPVITNFSRQMTRVHHASCANQKHGGRSRQLAFIRKMSKCDIINKVAAILYIKYLVGGGNELFVVKFIDECVQNRFTHTSLTSDDASCAYQKHGGHSRQFA